MFLVGNDKKVVEVENATFYVNENGKIAELLPCTFYVNENGKIAELAGGASPIYFSVSNSSVTSDMGIYVSEDELNTIAIAGVGGFLSHGGAIVTKDGVEYIVTARTGDANTQGVFYSTDGGNTWTKATPTHADPTKNYNNTSLVYNDGALWFFRTRLTQYSAVMDVYRSTDLVNWTAVVTGMTYTTNIHIGEVYTDRLIVGCSGTGSTNGTRPVVVYSIGTDGKITLNGNNDTNDKWLGKVFTNGVDCSVVTQINGAYSGSTKEWCLYYGNNLETKMAYPFDLSLLEVATFQSQDFGCYADGTWIFVASGMGKTNFYYSTNLKSWTLAQTVTWETYNTLGVICSDVKYIDGIVYALLSNVIYCSADKGKTWTKINDCPNVSNKFLRVGTL